MKFIDTVHTVFDNLESAFHAKFGPQADADVRTLLANGRQQLAAVATEVEHDAATDAQAVAADVEQLAAPAVSQNVVDVPLPAEPSAPAEPAQTPDQSHQL